MPPFIQKKVSYYFNINKQTKTDILNTIYFAGDTLSFCLSNTKSDKKYNQVHWKKSFKATIRLLNNKQSLEFERIDFQENSIVGFAKLATILTKFDNFKGRHLPTMTVEIVLKLAEKLLAKRTIEIHTRL